MSITALANAFNSVYKKYARCYDAFILSAELAKKALFNQSNAIISAFIFEFFAGVAPPNYALKRD